MNVFRFNMPEKLKNARVVRLKNRIQVEDYQFFGCLYLECVVLPLTLKKIGNSAFGGCIRLKKIYLPETVTCIGRYAFHDCPSLKEVYLPPDIRVIHKAVFSGCTGLTSISFPEHLESIEEEAFRNCSGLVNIRIHENIKKIDETAFQGCSGLTEYIVSEQNTEFASFDGALYDKNLTRLISCPPGKKSIFIPESTEEIGRNAFDSCDNLEEISVCEKNPVYASFDGILYNKAKDQLLTYPAGRTEVVLPETITRIAPCNFGDAKHLTSVTIPDSVTNIDHGAFLNCACLKKIRMSGNIAYIDEYTAFKGCDALETMTYRDFTFSFAKLTKWIQLSHIFKMISNMQAFVMSPDSQKTCLRRSILVDDNIYLLLIEYSESKDILRQMLETGCFANKENIDDFVSFAIHEHLHEVYLMLLDYKNQHIGYDDTEEAIRKKFEL